MSQHVLKNVRAYFEGHKVSGLTNQMSVSRSAQLQENTTLEDDNITRLPGLMDTNISLQAFWDNPEDESFFDAVGTANNSSQIFSFAPKPGATSAGSRGYTIDAHTAQSNRGGNIGEILPLTLELNGTDPLVRGLIAANLTVSSDQDGTIINLGSVGSDERLFASLHVLSASADSGVTPNLNVDVETGDSTFSSGSVTVQASFSTFSNIGAEMQKIAGAISDTHQRASFDVTGSGASFDVFMVFGIAK